MKKKFILLTVIGTYLIFVLSAPYVFAIPSEISFDIDVKEIKEPINPSVSKEISFKIKYKLNIGNFAKKFYLNRRIGRMLAFGFFRGYFFKFLIKTPDANLSISIDSPVWCKAELDKYNVELKYNNEFEEADVKLTFILNETAPALKLSEIKITAVYPGVGSINSISNSTNISFMPAYISDISIEAATNFTIIPLKETMIPINITNNGNGECSVNIIGFEKEKWNITTEQNNIIAIGETKEIMISVIPPKKFDNESITFTFAPMSTVGGVNNSYLQGKSVDFSITFYNDGSLKDDDNIDVTSIIIIAFIVIIILIIVFLLLRKKE